MNKLICICWEGFTGDHYEFEENLNKIKIFFENKLIIPSSLLIHFITIQDQTEPSRISLMEKIPVYQNFLSFNTSIIFNIALAEISNNYYLIILREKPMISSKITTKMSPSYRCLSINELFNKNLIKRIKYYHIPCKEQSNLNCFYDSFFICLCDLNRQSNCFKFNHNMNYDCYGENICLNQGQCFQDHPECSTMILCIYTECYYGSRCQFSSKG